MPKSHGQRSEGSYSIHRKCLEWIHGVYYRYTVETGTCVLEWWEAVLVNMYFIAIICSLAGQGIRLIAYLLRLNLIPLEKLWHGQ